MYRSLIGRTSKEYPPGKLLASFVAVAPLILLGSTHFEINAAPTIYKDLVILDTTTMAEIGRVPRAGGKGAQEVLYDVSLIPGRRLLC